MSLSPEAWAAIASATAAATSVGVTVWHLMRESKKSDAMVEGFRLAKAALEGYRGEIQDLRKELDRRVSSSLHGAEIARAREARLDADRKWNAAMDLWDRLGG